MGFRKDFPDVGIPGKAFREFSGGDHIEVLIPQKYDPQPKDQVPWKRGPLKGLAEILDCYSTKSQRKVRCIIKKMW